MTVTAETAQYTTHRFDAATITLHGGGTRHQLADVVKELGGTRILLVTDPGVVELGMAQPIIDNLTQQGLAVTLFSDVQPDPTQENVLKGFDALTTNQCDIVVGLGGGSP